jgi:hypothetical protein
VRILPAAVTERVAALGRAPRELAWLLIALVAGLTIAPWLVWAAGRLVLGTYANGGVFAFWGDFMRGLAQMSLPYWAIALGPYAALIAIRLVAKIVRD